MRAATAAFGGTVQGPVWAATEGDLKSLDFNSLCNRQRILEFYTQIPDCTVHLSVPKEKLNCPQIASLLVYLGNLSPPH